MRRNWWKVLVVVALIAAVAVVVAMKGSGPQATPKVAAKPTETTASDGADGGSAGKGEPAQPVKTGEVCPKPPPKSDKPKPAAQAKPTAKQPVPKRLPRLLDLGAEKCVPCKMMKPILAELEKEYAGKLKVEFINVWEDRAAAQEYGVDTIPTQIFYDADGEEFARHVGFFSKEDILATFRDHGIDLGGS